jgi:hypothetical protein
MAERRRSFVLSVTKATSMFAKNCSHNGSAHRHHTHGLLAKELHERAGLLLQGIVESHKAMHAAPSDEQRSACKHWIATRFAQASEEMGIFYLKQIHLEGTNPQTVFDTEVRREIQSAYAHIDNAFQLLERNYVERFGRFMVRILRPLWSMIWHSGK